MNYLFNRYGFKILYFQCCGNYLEAGKLLFQNGDYRKASEFFSKGNHTAYLAQAYEKSGASLEAAKLYEKMGNAHKAAEQFLKARAFLLAKHAFMALGQGREYAEILFREALYPEAAKIFFETDDYENGAKALLKAGKRYEASIALLKGYEEFKYHAIGMNLEPISKELRIIGEHAAKLLASTGQLRKASEVFWEIQKYPEAIDCIASIEAYDEAAELAEETGYLDKAITCWEKAGNISRAGTLRAEKLATEGKILSAIETFLQANDQQRAADLYVQLKEFKKAAYHYEKAGHISEAAYYYRLTGGYEKAGKLYQGAKLYKEALECFEKGQLFDLEVSLRTLNKDHLGLAQRYLELGYYSPAISHINNIKKGDPNYIDSLGVKGRIFFATGRYAEAKESIQLSVKSKEKLGNQDLDNLYLLARIPQDPEAVKLSLSILNDKIEANLIHPRLVRKAVGLKQSIESPAFEHLKSASLPSLDAVISSQNIHEDANAENAPRRYSKLEEIGRGGMGIVYRAIDNTLDRIVALKILPPSLYNNPNAISIFMREAKSAAALNHPHIITVYDFGQQGHDIFIAMEHIEGKTLKSIIRERQEISHAEIKVYAQHILDALSYAHQKNIVHRDLTTSNIMLSQPNGIKIMDFGLAKVLDQVLNEQSLVGGTPSFMSPEQTLGNAVDHRTDIYSFGVCLFELLTKRLPFQGGNMAYHHVHTAPPLLHSIDPNILTIFQSIVTACLEKKPENRPQNANEIVDLLSQI